MALPFSRTLGAGTHQLTVSDINILCDTSFGVVNLRLPKISNIVSFGASQGYGIGSLSLFTLNITDISNNASANNINILPTSGNFFSNNLPNLKIDTNNGSVVLKPASELLWNVNVSSTGSSTPIIALGSGSGSSYRIGNNNSVSSNYGTVSGGYFNIDNGACASTIGGGGCNSISGYRMNTISGGYSNTASGYYQATIGGGYANTSSNCYTTVAGGATNISSGRGSTIGGGYSNDSTNDYSTISGGYNNTASGNCSTISGGYNNAATGGSSTVSGGYNNSTSGYASTISGGYNNSTSAAYTGILGGKNNQTNFSDSMIVGSDIIADRSCTTFVNNLSIMNIPVSSVGLPAGSVWNNGGVLNIV